jgi:hypothetical protein
MRSFNLPGRHFLDGKINLLILRLIIIAAILCMILFSATGTSHATDWTASGMFNPVKDKFSCGFHQRISNAAVSFIQGADAGFRSSGLSFKHRSVKAYRYHDMRYKMLRKIMGLILIPIFYIVKYARISLFFFFFITTLLVIIDESHIRHKENLTLSEEPKSKGAKFKKGNIGYAPNANYCFYDL